MPTFEYVVEGSFDAAHSLPNYDGPCKFLHGHTWKVRILVSVFVMEQLFRELEGLLIDFKLIKSCFRKYDHTHLNASFPFPFRPTAETLACTIWSDCYNAITRVDPTLTIQRLCVELWESVDSCVTIRAGAECACCVDTMKRYVEGCITP